MRRAIQLAVLFGLAAAATGCGPGPRYTVSGTVTRGGEKLTWPDGGRLLVVFLPADPDKTERYPARDTDTATSRYEVKGIPAGRYRVAVQQFDEKFMDALKGAYDPGHTTHEVQVTADGQTLDIDLPKELPRREKAGKKGE